MSVTQPTLPLFDSRTMRQPRKRVRAVSKAQYAVLRDTPGLLTARQHQVLTAIAAMYNASQVWPTRTEIAHWMFTKGWLPRPDHALIAPRITELSRGTMNRATRQYEGGGNIEALPKRPCRIAKTSAHPWRLTEAGAIYRIGQ